MSEARGVLEEARTQIFDKLKMEDLLFVEAIVLAGKVILPNLARGACLLSQSFILTQKD